MLTSAPSAREAAMEFVNERLKPEIMGDYQQGRADLVSGSVHEPFSGAHIVPATSGTSRTSGDSDYNVEGNGQNAVDNSNAVNYGGQRHLSERGTQTESSGQGNYEGPRYQGSGRNTVNAETSGGVASQVTDSSSSGRVYSGGVSGEDMRNLYNENQGKLKDYAGEYSGPQNELQQKVAGQRSENEQNINNSAGEIGKKQSTVQASSDILRGEDLSAAGKFQKGRAEAELDQSSKMNPFNDLQPDEINKRIKNPKG
ncbi:hypothetical protein D3C80_1259310 [compost metagenome]